MNTGCEHMSQSYIWEFTQRRLIAHDEENAQLRFSFRIAVTGNNGCDSRTTSVVWWNFMPYSHIHRRCNFNCIDLVYIKMNYAQSKFSQFWYENGKRMPPIIQKWSWMSSLNAGQQRIVVLSITNHRSFQDDEGILKLKDCLSLANSLLSCVLNHRCYI